MPAPDPDALGIEEREGGRFTITATVSREGNRRHRIARMMAVSRRLSWGRWKCQHCGEPVPLFKRADAQFCAERCRKADARQRRRWRGA